MSPPYRKERERMAAGQTVPLFRVIVDLGRSRWGTVQAGLTQEAADALLENLLKNEQAKRLKIRGARYVL